MNGELDRDEFVKILSVLGALYPRTKIEDPTVKAYYVVLQDLPADLLKAAVLQLGSESKWFPTAAELRSTAFELLERENGKAKMTAHEAWGEVTRKIGSVGYMREPEFEDPLTYRAVEAIGGWRRLCHSQESMMASNRARFIEAFEKLRAQEREDARMLPQVREVAGKLSYERPKLPAGEGIDF